MYSVYIHFADGIRRNRHAGKYEYPSGHSAPVIPGNDFVFPADGTVLHGRHENETASCSQVERQSVRAAFPGENSVTGKTGIKTRCLQNDSVRHYCRLYVRTGKDMTDINPSYNPFLHNISGDIRDKSVPVFIRHVFHRKGCRGMEIFRRQRPVRVLRKRKPLLRSMRYVMYDRTVIRGIPQYAEYQKPVAPGLQAFDIYGRSVPVINAFQVSHHVSVHVRNGKLHPVISCSVLSCR